MGCGCNKKKPRSSPAKSGLLVRNVTRANVPNPQTQSQTVQQQGVQSLSNNPQTDQNQPVRLPPPTQDNLSPSGLDAQQRRMEQMRREAIRRALNKN